MTISYPRTIFVVTTNPGREDEALIVAQDPNEVEDIRGFYGETSVKVARYVLAGTGVVHTDNAYYVEDSRSHQAPQCDEECPEKFGG